MGLKLDEQYPDKPPYVYIVDMKGLDDNRQSYLVTRINDKAQELSSYLMLVALCEEAVEILSNMNHPEGDCPLCLYPLVREDKFGAYLPFMKLMSCYHCFHSECIIRLWKWFQEQEETNEKNQGNEASAVCVGEERGLQSSIKQLKANCPVCRKVFDEKDMEHTIDYLGTSSSHQMSSAAVDIDEDEKLYLQTQSENSRREKFEALLKLQLENNGLIEPKKNLAILPGIFLPESVAKPSTSKETENEECVDDAVSAKTEVKSVQSLNKATTSRHNQRDSRRKNKYHSPKKPLHAPPNRQQWVKREL